MQSIWSAAHLRLPILIVVLRNQEYAILRAFAELQGNPCVPGLDLPDLDTVSIAKGYGCDAARVRDLNAIEKTVDAVWAKNVPTVTEVPISPQVLLLR